MQRAGAAAASEIALRVADRLEHGVLVLAGPGNNGGDAWVVARALGAVGVRVRVVEPVEAKTDDARAERELFGGAIDTWDGQSSFDRGEALVVDGLLGTGASGAPRGPIAAAIEGMTAMRSRGAFIVALDLPSGLDADATAPAGAFTTDLTLTFGTLKRAHLVHRARCGAVVALDIGLGNHAQLDDGAPCCVDERWVAEQVPPIDADAHKGTRKKLAIVGGAPGMAGAAMLAARAALRSGIGMVKLVVAPESMGPVQEGEPYALAAPWSANVATSVANWADAIVIGPGLGNTQESRALVERILGAFDGPVLLDADALNVFAGEQAALAKAIGKRAALITPHPAELARLTGVSVDEVLAQRFEIGARVAGAIGAAVLLKGVPTVVSQRLRPLKSMGSDSIDCLVSATGNAALATAGSGDVLSGIAGTLLAQTGDPLVAGAAGAWIHGRAAELATTTARGATLEDVVAALRDSWHFRRAPLRYPVIAELPPLSS